MQGRVFRKLLKLALPFWRYILLATVLGFLTIGSSIALMSTSAWLIARAALQPSIAELNLAIVGVRAFGISRGVFRYLERLVSHDVTFRLLKNLRVWFYQAIEPLAPAQLLKLHSGDLLASIVGDIETLENFYVRVLAPPLVAGLVGLAMVGFTWAFSPVLALIVVVFFLFTGIALPVLVWQHNQHTQDLPERRGELSALLLDGVQGMADILYYDQLDNFKRRLQEKAANLKRGEDNLTRGDILIGGAGPMMASFTVFAVLWLAIPRVDPIYLGVLALGVTAAYEAMLPLALSTNHLTSNLAAGKRLLNIVEAAPAVKNTGLAVPQSASVAFKNVSFRYEDQWILQNINFELPPGKKMAIVGPSGAGKSTIVNLLVRFWDITAGEISLDNRPVAAHDLMALRDTFAVVPQRIHLFNTSVRENLRIANPQADYSAMVQATQAAQIHEFILSLPDGYDTRVGEHGLQLSGGERQRLALARAFLKDAPVLVLDEALSNLDALTEQKVMDDLLRQSSQQSLLMITHRLKNMTLMDEILVMQQGYIVEFGTHQTLLAKRGLYYELIRQQQNQLPD